jgi:hypothetical protein
LLDLDWLEIYRRDRPLRSFVMSTPPAPDLTGVHAKLDRAEEHIDALRDEIKPVMEGLTSAQAETRHNVLDDSYSVIMRQSAALPVVRWGIMLGDVCHNMRSALNHLVCALVPVGQVHRRHQFPIFDTPHSWKSEFGGTKPEKMLDFIDPTHFALIESVQPFQQGTGMQRLSLLERFSNNDKHRLIHAAVTAFITRATMLRLQKWTQQYRACWGSDEGDLREPRRRGRTSGASGHRFVYELARIQ